jgi:hypothetical protein
MYILIGAIAVQVGFGHPGRQADRAGALRLVASTPFGEVALWLLVIGFTGMALWRLSQASWGTGGQDGRKASRRLATLARAVFYGVVTFSILTYAIGLGAPSSSDRQSRDLTATALHYPGGQVVVVLSGLGFLAGGCYLAYRAFRKKFLRHLRMSSASPAGPGRGQVAWSCRPPPGARLFSPPRRGRRRRPPCIRGKSPG